MMYDINAASLDNWITGGYGENQLSDLRVCEDCIYWDCGHCTNENSEYLGLDVAPLDWCDVIDVGNPIYDEPQDFSEKRALDW